MLTESEIDFLLTENKQLRATVEILSRDIGIHYQRSRGAEYVEARAERISSNIVKAIAQFEKFKEDICSVLVAKNEMAEEANGIKKLRKKMNALYKKIEPLTPKKKTTKRK